MLNIITDHLRRVAKDIDPREELIKKTEEKLQELLNAIVYHIGQIKKQLEQHPTSISIDDIQYDIDKMKEILPEYKELKQDSSSLEAINDLDENEFKRITKKINDFKVKTADMSEPPKLDPKAPIGSTAHWRTYNYLKAVDEKDNDLGWVTYDTLDRERMRDYKKDLELIKDFNDRYPKGKK